MRATYRLRPALKIWMIWTTYDVMSPPESLLTNLCASSNFCAQQVIYCSFIDHNMYRLYADKMKDLISERN